MHVSLQQCCCMWLIIVFHVASASRPVLQDPLEALLAQDQTPCLSSNSIAAAGAPPPWPHKESSKLVTAAGEVPDDFGWLRDDTRSNPAVLRYLEAENAYSQAVLQQLHPLAAQLAQEMQERVLSTTEAVPVRQGSWWYSEQQLRSTGPVGLVRRPAEKPFTAAAGGADTAHPADSASYNTAGSSANMNNNKPGDTRRGGGAVSRGSSSTGRAVLWEEAGPDMTAGEQVVLDPFMECALLLSQQQEAKAASSSSSQAAAAAASKHLQEEAGAPAVNVASASTGDDASSSSTGTGTAPATPAQPQQAPAGSQQSSAASTKAVPQASASAAPPPAPAADRSASSCDVMGATVSPDGTMVAYGVDVGGSEQHLLLVRHLETGRSLLQPPIPHTNGNYEWTSDSKGVFCITRNSTTKRPDSVWFVRVSPSSSSSSDDAAAPPQPVLLWQEQDPAFYLSLSRSSSGRFLQLSVASQVTQQVLLLDVALPAGRAPSRQDWLQLAPRRARTQFKAVGHWQQWIFMLVVGPGAENGELRVAAVDQPQQHLVILPPRSGVELEDMRLFAHHLVLAERQLGHTTITVHCLPNNSSAEAVAACRYNSTAAAAAKAYEQAAADATAATAAAVAAAEQQGPPSSSEDDDDGTDNDSSDSDSADQGTPKPPADRAPIPPELPPTQPVIDSADAADAVAVNVWVVPDTGSGGSGVAASHATAGPAAPTAAGHRISTAAGPAAATININAALPLLSAAGEGSSSDGGAFASSGSPDAFVLIRGRAGSSPESSSTAAPEHIDYGAGESPAELVGTSSSSMDESTAATTAAAAAGKSSGTGGAGQQQQQQRQKRADAALDGDGSAPEAQAGPTGNAASHSKLTAGKPAAPPASTTPAAAAGLDRQHTRSLSAQLPPLLLPDNSWQVTFEEDTYSVSMIDSGAWDNPLLRLSYTSFTTPQSVVDIHMHTQRRSVRSVARVGGGFRPEDYRSYRLWVQAADGVQVPVSLCYRLDTFARNGLNPALLHVYGAYGVKFDPEFDPKLLSLLDRGWVVGIAHVRGGGELGHAWHADGRLELKTNSFSDLVAAAEALVANNITSFSRLALWARSAGGLTAAAAVNSHPGLFQAAVLDVPFLDVLGDLVDGALPLTVKEWEEWGNPLLNATHAAVIAQYSPTLAINSQAISSYPHMLVTSGLQDVRVGYWEAAKYVAQLRAAAGNASAATTSSSKDDSSSTTANGGGVGGGSSSKWPWSAEEHRDLQQQQQQQQHAAEALPVVLLRTDMRGGHFTASAGGSAAEGAALKYAFLIAALPGCSHSQQLLGLDDAYLTGSVSGGGGSGGGWEGASSAHSSSTSMMTDAGMWAVQHIPQPLQQCLVGLVVLLVASGLIAAAYQAGKLLWHTPTVSHHDVLISSSSTTMVDLGYQPHAAAAASAAAPRRQARSRFPGKRWGAAAVMTQDNNTNATTISSSSAAAAEAAAPFSPSAACRWPSVAAHDRQQQQQPLGDGATAATTAALLPTPASLLSIAPATPPSLLPAGAVAGGDGGLIRPAHLVAP